MILGELERRKNYCYEKAKNFALNKEPIASLTRFNSDAKNDKLLVHTPETEGALSDVQGCMLSVGLGEASTTSSSNIHNLGKFREFGIIFKKRAHLDALRKAYQGNYFSESMFVRFRAKSMRGTWKGKNFD